MIEGVESVVDDMKDVIYDVKEKVGNTGFFLIIGGVVAVFIFFLSKGKNGDTEVTYNPPSTVNGYPDVVENADVVSSSVASNIEYAKQEVMDYLGEVQGSVETLENRVTETEKATQNYIEEGLKAMEDLSAKVDTLETHPQVQYVPVSQPTSQPATTNNNNWLGDMANFVTSNGMTVSQNVGLLGTSYMGSTVTGVSTDYLGNTTIQTKDGKKYQNGKLIN